MPVNSFEARRVRGVVVAVCLVALFSAPVRPARSQSTLGTIRGTAWDPQRQLVPHVSIVVVDEATGVSRAADTGPTGDYEVSNLRAGRYRIEATAATGFKAFQRPGVTLAAGEAVRVDIALEIGPSSDIVTVTAASPTIHLESQAIEGGLDAQQLQALPRGTRDFQSFLYLNPNVVGDADNGFQFLGGRTYGVSYLQDGQPSTGAIFGNVTNASPGLDAIAEIKVLSNSYSAEYGGLAAVVVTSRRGGNSYSGSAFYDFNADELNARTYPQILAGLERGFPGSDTRDHRYGITYGGPIKRNRTFFLFNYERLDQDAVGGGAIVPVPTDGMRAGDFSATSFIVRDPLTGQPFPGNVIPADRISPIARNVLRFFYPRANLTPLANGIGRSQQFVNVGTTRNRWDARVDHELSARDSVFGRASWQFRTPGASFENSSLPNLGSQDRQLQSRTVTGSWTRTMSDRMVNELRGGYNFERSNRRSHFVAADVASTLELEIPRGGLGRRGYPAFTFQGGNSIRGIADNSQNANRDTRTGAFTISDTLTWLGGRHSFKAGGLYSRQSILDGFSLGVTGAAGNYTFTGAATGNSFADFLLGLPSRTDEGINTRGTSPLDAYSNELAVFAQDDWKVTTALTLFLGARYALEGTFIERNNLLINFDPKTAALVLPSQDLVKFLSPEAERLPRRLASDLGVGRALVRNDANNISPRVGLAYRVGSDNRTVLRAGAGYVYPTNAAQGIRDALSRSPFRFAKRRTNPTFAQGFSTGTLSNRSLFGLNAVDLDLESAEALQYNLTVERELPAAVGLRVSYLGTSFRKLLVNRDINTAPPSTVPFDLENPVDRLRLPYPNLDPFLNKVENAGSGVFRAMQIEGRRRFRNGLAFNAAYTLASSESTAPDLGNSTLGVVQYAPYDLELDRGPDPEVVKHRFIADATWELPVGSGRPLMNGLPSWVDALVGGWTVATILQARSGQHLTPFFTYGTDPFFPANTGKAYDTNNSFGEAWRPDVVGNPDGSRARDNFFNLDAFRLPARGTVGTAKKGSLTGPGTWVVNVGLYKTLVGAGRVNAEFRATIDNAFNHPQFLTLGDSGFLDLTDLLINGVRDNGVTNVLREVGSLEGFAAARVVRLGVRLQF